MPLSTSIPRKRTWRIEKPFMFVEDCGDFMFAELNVLLNSGEIEEAKARLQEASNIYYSSENEEDYLLTDFEYDTIFLRIYGNKGKSFESNIDKNFVSNDHPELAGWLAKFHEETISDWYTKFPASKESPLILSPKYDGSAVTIVYRADGSVKSAVTRGEGDKGQDVTRLFKSKNHLKPQAFSLIKKLGCKVEEFAIKYECTLSFKNLEKVNEIFEKDYKNPRNAVPGIMRSSKTDVKILDYLSLCPLDISFKNCDADRLSRLTTLGDIVDQKLFILNNIIFEFVLVESDEDFSSFYEELSGERRLTNDIMLDGMIAETTDWTFGDETDCPEFVAALKFPALTAESRIIDVEWEEGSSGRLTPVAIFDAVKLGGRTFERASLANVKRFDELKLKERTKIVLELRNDILMYVTRKDFTFSDPEERSALVVPNEIEYFTYNEHNQRVFAYKKPSLAQNIERMLMKMGIKGIKIERLKAMCDCKMIRHEKDIFNLNLNNMKKFAGFNGAISEFIYNEIESVKQAGIEDYKLLAGLNIIGIGNTITKQVCNLVEFSFLLDTSYYDDIRDGLVEYIGPETSRKLIEGLYEKNEVLREVHDVLASNLIYTVDSIKQIDEKDRQTIVVTGDLDNFERSEFKKVVEEMGHKMTGSVSKKTTMLITNSPNIKTVKLEKAVQLGIPILTEEEALKLLKIEKTAKSKTIDNSTPEATTTGSIFNI